jgi:hypothetical protein
MNKGVLGVLSRAAAKNRALTQDFSWDWINQRHCGGPCLVCGHFSLAMSWACHSAGENGLRQAPDENGSFADLVAGALSLSGGGLPGAAFAGALIRPN